MRLNVASFLRRLRRDESGAVAVLVAISIVALLGLTALAIDLGNLIYAQRRLQATTDLAALSGGAAYSYNASMVSTATAYSAASGDQNAQHGLNVTMATGYPKLYCLTSTEIGCPTSGPNSGANAEGGTGGNAVEVRQQATVPLIFGGWFGFNSVTLTATSLASAKGGALPPLNVMLVIDNTASMNATEGTGISCGGFGNATRIQCALAGVQILLSELWPTQDQVGMMVFPGLLNPSNGNTSNGASSAANDVSCSSSVKNICDYSGTTCGDIEIVSYSSSPVYQLVTPTNSGGGSTNSYCSVSKGSCGTSTSLSTSSPVVSASCQSGMTQGATSCGTCAGEKVQGGEGTYYAGAINAAQAALVATNKTGVCATQNCQNVIILLSDGGAGNASNLATLTTDQSTAPGLTTLYFASGSIPADVIPGTSVADNTSPDTTVIPAGASVVSTTATTVTISTPVVALATANTDKVTPTGSTTLTFASVPTAVTSGLLVTDQTNPSAIPTGTTVVSTTATTVTISNPVTGTVAATDTTSAATDGGSTTLNFASVPAAVQIGMTVTDTTSPAAIPTETTVVSKTATTVTISNAAATSTTVTGKTSGTIKSGSKTLTLTSAPTGVTSGFAVSGTDIAAGTTVTALSGTTVTISTGTTGQISGSETITFTVGVHTGDTINFSTDLANGDVINFGGVKSGDTISFGTNNQCHEAITAAQNAASAGTWVYSIAYGSYIQNSPNSNSCSDTETPPISSCATMQAIASDPTKFYSDPMGLTSPNGPCTSPANPNYTTIAQIFANIGLNLLYTQLLPPNTN